MKAGLACTGVARVPGRTNAKNSAIEPHYFVTHNWCDISAFIEFFGGKRRSEPVRALQIESILPRCALRGEFCQFSDRCGIIQIDDGRRRALARNATDNI